MRVKEVMDKEVIRVKRSTSLRSLLNLFKDFHTLPLIPVVDDKNCLIGVVHLNSLRDILKPAHTKFLKNLPFAEIDENVFDLELSPAMGDLILVDDIMDTKFISLREDEALESAYKIMSLHNKYQLLVTGQDRRLLGIVGVFDIVRRAFKEKGIV